MTPQRIVDILDAKCRRGDAVEGRTTWKGRGSKFSAGIDKDGDVCDVLYNIRPGVYVGRETRFAAPYGAPANQRRHRALNVE